MVHHFTAAGKCYFEMDQPNGRRSLWPVKFRFAGNTLTVIYSFGSERDFDLTAEDDGSVCVPSPNGTLWWMVRLAAPEPYLRAFVDEYGQLQKLGSA